jgi:hypothetical protein
MSSRVRALILCSDGPPDRYLVHRLGECCDLVAVFVESQEDQARARRKRINRLLGAYHSFRRRLMGCDRIRRRAFALPAGVPEPLAPPAATATVSINSPHIVAAAHELDYDLVVVRATTIIRERTLGTFKAPVINIHGGMLPHYKGNHCMFYAVREQRLDRVGATIHYVDRGIDTGAIVEVVRPPARLLNRTIHPEQLYCVSVRGAIDRLASLLADASTPIRFPATRNGAHGKTFLMRDRSPADELVVLYMRLRHALARAFRRERHLGPGGLGHACRSNHIECSLSGPSGCHGSLTPSKERSS